MIRQFLEDRAEKRQALSQAVADIRETLTGDADKSETLRTLPEASVTALTDAGPLAIKCPRELAGAEADPVPQLEVIEALTYIDPRAGWCYLIRNGTLSVVAAFWLMTQLRRCLVVTGHLACWRADAENGLPRRWWIPRHRPLFVGQWYSARRMGRGADPCGVRWGQWATTAYGGLRC